MPPQQRASRSSSSGRSSRSSLSSSSDSSDSSSSSSSSHDDSSDSSADGRCARNRESTSKLERLRRIFLSQPTAVKRERSHRVVTAAVRPRASRSPQRRYSATTTARRCPRVHRQAFVSPQHSQRRRSSVASRPQVDLDDTDAGASSTDDDTRQQGSRSRARPQLSIDAHVHALCEHVDRLTAERESTTSQMHALLDQALDELEFVKKQEERTLERSIQQIEESFALRLEVFEQQYLAKVADIQREMQTAIQQQRDRAEAAIVAAATQLHEKTRRAAVPVGPSFARTGSAHSPDARAMHRADSVASAAARLGLSTPERKATASASDQQQQSHPYHDNNNNNGNDSNDWQSRAWRVSRLPPRSLARAASLSTSCLELAEAAEEEELSPVAKQKAKLRALEAKLASFSQDAVERITTELKGTGGSKRAAPRRPAQTTPSVPSLLQQPRQRDEDEHGSSLRIDRDWPAAPLSPLRTNASYWRNGISFEQTHRLDRADHDGRVSRRSASPDHQEHTKQEHKRSEQRLSSRFLRPEEEVELRRLRNSIGLAKDWMEQHT